jgi:hypothetical protein
MPFLEEDLKTMTAPQKARLFNLLKEDKELENYLISNEAMFQELALRDRAFAEGKIKITTRKQLSDRLKNRRDAL